MKKKRDDQKRRGRDEKDNCITRCRPSHQLINLVASWKTPSHDQTITQLNASYK